MKGPVSADDIRENLKEVFSQLHALHAQGRIVMAEVSLNNDWTNTAVAVTAALGGLELALDAIYWMQTLPNSDGDYPLLIANLSHDAPLVNRHIRVNGPCQLQGALR